MRHRSGTKNSPIVGLFFDSGNEMDLIPDEAPTLLPEPSQASDDSPPLDFLPDDDDIVYSVDWSDTYKQARTFLFGSGDAEPDFTAARDLFLNYVV